MTEPIGSPHLMPAHKPVVIEGAAELQNPTDIAGFVGRINAKYRTDYAIDFFSAAENACFRVQPRWAFGLTESDFTGSPTRWVLAAGES